MITLEMLPWNLTVCKVSSVADMKPDADFFFLAKTDEELSLVCRTADAPLRTVERSDGWRGFRVAGPLDFSLIGILSKLTAALAENSISVFAVSTYNTDYVLVKAEDFDRAMAVLAQAGYGIGKD